MQSMKSYVRNVLSDALGIMFEHGQIFAMPTFEVDVPKNAKSGFGDYSTNVAFSIARSMKVNPQEAADSLVREIKLLDQRGLFNEVTAVNGFINFSFTVNALAEAAADIKIPQYGAGKKVLFEYSSPNTNKPLHIGHTRNDVFGVACINLLKATGHEVVSCEVLNDRGVHIMKSMLMYMRHGSGSTPESAGVKGDHFIGKFYQMFAAECAVSEEAKTELEESAQGLLQKWEAGDAEVRELWQKMNAWFYAGIQETYEAEGSHFDFVDRESEVYDKGRDIVLAGIKKGIFQKEDDGSASVDLTSQGLDKKYLLRSDGTTMYITQDMYLWSSRDERYHPDAAIVVTSSEQAYHFQVLGKIFELLGYEWAVNFSHLPYEHVYLGKTKMSSRAGNTMSADDLLTTVKEKVRETMAASHKARASADDSALVEAVAFGAIKYGYLKYDRNTKIYFDVDETVAVEGNTGPYLQYAYARIMSILRKFNYQSLSATADLPKPAHLSEPSELDVLRTLVHYPEIVLTAAEEMKPNLICSYLFELASKFNVFYDQVSILHDERNLQWELLSLCASVANVLAHGLEHLGIKTVEEM
jgi:arginyl-tRNA synthetase